MKIFLKTVSLVTILTGFLLSSCVKELAKEPEFGPGDYPRIFYNQAGFPATIIINANDTAKYTGISYSPACKVKISWKVNDQVISNDTSFYFSPSTGGEFNIKLEVEHNGLVTVRNSTVLVKPATYSRKSYSKVVMGYLSEDGLPSSVKWNFITHLAAQIGKVSDDGSLDVSRGNQNQMADELVARGHTRGIPVLLALYGRLSAVDGWGIYESDDMGPAIRDATKRTALVEQVVSYVTARKMDGVDIMMTDLSSVFYSENLAAIGPFVNELRAALPTDAIITVSVTAGWEHWEYPDLSNADWVNVRAFEDGEHVGPGAPTGQASSYDYMLSASSIWLDNHLPANKIVVGFPVFGLRYTALDPDGNCLDWSSYDYVPYKSILSIEPTADTKEFVQSAEGIYYNGVPLIEQKANYVKASEFKGMYGWYIDADAADSSKSLFVKAYSKLNP